MLGPAVPSLKADILTSSYADRQTVDKTQKEDTVGTAYPLATLKHSGALWPKFWWRPDCDGGACSFPGIEDRTFNPDTTLATGQHVGARRVFRPCWRSSKLV